MKKTSSFTYNTFLSACANIITRALGFFYRIFIGRFIGAEGMGLHGLVMPVYQICCTIIASGLPTANMSLVSECIGAHNQKGVRTYMHVSLYIVFLISLILSASVIVFAKPLAHILGDERIQPCLFVLGFAILITGFENIYKSYFYCIGRAKIPSGAEITEQLVRVFFVIALLYVYRALPLSYLVTIVISGIVVGEAVSSLFLFFSYKKYMKKSIHPIKSNRLHSAKRLLSVAVPITGTKLFTSIIGSVTNILVPGLLVAYGHSYKEALSIFGVLSGMVMPLLFLPYTLTNALSVNIVPYISSRLAQSERARLNKKLEETIITVSCAAFCIAAVLSALADPVGIILYKEPLVGTYLPLMAPGTVFSTLGHIVTSMLIACKKEKKASLYSAISSVISLVITALLLPMTGINGFIIGFNISSIFVFVLCLRQLKQCTGIKISTFSAYIMPLLFGTVSFLISSNTYSFLSLYCNKVSSLIISGGIGSVLTVIFTLFSIKHKNYLFIKKHLD